MEAINLASKSILMIQVTLVKNLYPISASLTPHHLMRTTLLGNL